MMIDNCDIVRIFPLNIVCEHSLKPVSNEYPQSILKHVRSKLRKITYPCTPQFYYIKAGIEVVLII